MVEIAIAPSPIGNLCGGFVIDTAMALSSDPGDDASDAIAGYYVADKVHPNQTGYNILGKFLADEIPKILSTPRKYEIPGIRDVTHGLKNPMLFGDNKGIASSWTKSGSAPVAVFSKVGPNTQRIQTSSATGALLYAGISQFDERFDNTLDGSEFFAVSKLALSYWMKTPIVVELSIICSNITTGENEYAYSGYDFGTNTRNQLSDMLPSGELVMKTRSIIMPSGGTTDRHRVVVSLKVYGGDDLATVDVFSLAAIEVA